MSNNESFIDEVTEEVRRDQLYGYLRRYGWIAVLVVLLLVGGAAWREYVASRDTAQAQALGDSLYTALGNDAPAARAEALSGVGAEGPARVVPGFLAAAAQEEAGDRVAAVETLEAVAADAAVPGIYRDLARLKALMIDTGRSPEASIEALQPLAAPGEPFRLIAMEQVALAQISDGDTDAALATLSAIQEDASVKGGLRDRAGALIVALGGDPEEEEEDAAEETVDALTAPEAGTGAAPDAGGDAAVPEDGTAPEATPDAAPDEPASDAAQEDTAPAEPAGTNDAAEDASAAEPAVEEPAGDAAAGEPAAQEAAGDDPAAADAASDDPAASAEADGTPADAASDAADAADPAAETDEE